MTESGPVWSDDVSGLVIRVSRQPRPAALDLLGRTVWGSRDLRYRIHDIPARLGRMTRPYFLSLERHGTLAAVCVLNRRQSGLLGVSVDAFHFAMLATEPAFSGQGLAGLLAEQAGEFCRTRIRAPGAAYAYIESSTDYSIRISQRLGTSLEAVLPLTVFSRLRPADDPRAGPIEAHEAEPVAKRLAKLYDGHLFTDFGDSVLPEEYHVLRRGGAIVAGAQAERLNWSVESLPGIAGWAVTRLLPRLPPLRRLLNPANLELLRFGNLLAEPGREDDLLRLLEAILARHKAPLGLILLDARSPVYRRIRAHGALGMLGRVVDGASKMVVDFAGVDEADLVRIRKSPVLMSPLDVF